MVTVSWAASSFNADIILVRIPANVTGDSGIVTDDSGKQLEIGHDKTEWTVTFARNSP